MGQSHTIFIVLSTSGTKCSKFLKLMSDRKAEYKTEFTHVSISFEDDLSTLHSFARRGMYVPFIAGYIEEHPNKGILNKYNPMCEVLTLEINHEKYLKLLELVSEFNRNPLKYKYNFIGLICLYFKIPHKLHRHFTCTEFVAWLLGNIDISPNVDKDVSLIVPNDYYKIPSVKSVYRGRIQSFCLA